MKGLTEPSESAASFRHLYLALYVIGSLAALAGQGLGD
jgi:hypothetical protein